MAGYKEALYPEADTVSVFSDITFLADRTATQYDRLLA